MIYQYKIDRPAQHARGERAFAMGPAKEKSRR
jgi:hypothetical protein